MIVLESFFTEITAINPMTGKLVKFVGPKVLAKNFEEAQIYCNNNGLGYCEVVARLTKSRSHYKGFEYSSKEIIG